MRIQVLLFGQLKELVGKSEETLDLGPGAELSAVIAHYTDQFPVLKALMPSLACSVNEEYASVSSILKDGDVVGLLPPVSGGSPPQVGSRECSIVHTKIDTVGLIAGLKAPADGACVVFEGVVRNNSRGRSTLYLEYEAYEGMALKELEKLAKEALERYPVRDVRITHRLGKVEIGEASVVIAVGAAHRAAAFDACRWLIDTLKKVVPIWKKEYFEDGAIWADGEEFPEEIQLRPGTAQKS